MSALPDIEPQPSPKIRAMPGRLILEFPPPVRSINGVDIPESSAYRPEIGTLVDIGDDMGDEETRILRREILDRAKAGEKFLVPMASGTPYWRVEMGKFGERFIFLKNVRTFRISEIATSIMLGE